MASRGTPATALLARSGTTHTVHEYAHDPRVASYGDEAAEALGVAYERVFKTLVAEVDRVLVVAVIPVARSLDLKALAATRGGKRATMADPRVVERTTGYVLGGVSPLGQRKRLPTVVDSSAAEHPTVYVSGGRRGLEIELPPADLIALTGAMTAAVSTG